MTTYFIRRMMLMIPTFIGSTLIVFIILQLAPGGPLEQAIQRIQMGAAAEGEAAGSASEVMSDGGSTLPSSAMKQLKRFYGFDKPIWQRYLIWLGIFPREIKHRSLEFDIDETEIEKRVGKQDGQIWKVNVQREGDKLTVLDNGAVSKIWKAHIEETDDDG